MAKKCFRTITQKSKKVYDRKRLKKADIKNIDDLPFLATRVHTYGRMKQDWFRCRSLPLRSR